MRFVIAILSGIGCLALIEGATAAEIRGFASCGQWVKEREQEKAGRRVQVLAYQAWLIGYLSGLGVGADKEFIRDVDNESIFLWIDNYCRANPLKRTFEGANQLFDAHAKDR